VSDYEMKRIAIAIGAIALIWYLFTHVSIHTGGDETFSQTHAIVVAGSLVGDTSVDIGAGNNGKAATIVCPNCGKTINAGDIFCPYCGERLKK